MSNDYGYREKQIRSVDLVTIWALLVAVLLLGALWSFL
jgi:hypothetical protein